MSAMSVVGLFMCLFDQTARCLELPWHHQHIEVEFGRAERKVHCSCGRAYAMSDPREAFVPWDEEFDELYHAMGFVW